MRQRRDLARELAGWADEEAEAWAAFVAALSSYERAVRGRRPEIEVRPLFEGAESARMTWAEAARAKHVRGREAMVLLGIGPRVPVDSSSAWAGSRRGRR